MPSSPRVTVIIATYNYSTVLPFAIDSVLGQTFDDFELLVIGDGCTDDSAQVVTAIEDTRVRWINLAANTGHQSGPNNRGLQEARGEYIAYLGHDDIWLSHHLECSIHELEATGAAMSQTLALRVLPGNTIGLPHLRQGGAPSSRMHRRSIVEKIGGWNDYRSLKIAPETDLYLRALDAGFAAIVVPRLSVIKFPAARRKDAYLNRPNHEQDEWSRRAKSEPTFEATYLAHMIQAMVGEMPREMPIRRLASTFGAEIASRTVARFRRATSVDSSGIDKHKKFKGL